MTQIFLRIRHRNTSSEGDEEQFYLTEFAHGAALELSLSVYEIEDGYESLCRIVAEYHAVAPDRERPKTKKHFNVSGLEPRAPIRTDGPERFGFLRDAHREIRFENEAELREFAYRLLREIEHRHHEVKRADVQNYLASRLGDDPDPEWVDFFESEPQVARLG